MKIIYAIVFLLPILSFASQTPEEARELYNLNTEVMSNKEIKMNPSICKWQNELAEIAGEKKYECIENRNSLNDTTKGDVVVRDTLKEAEQMSDLSIKFNKYEQMIESKRDLDYLVDKLEN